MKILHSANYVENGQLNYIIAIAPDEVSLPDATYTPDGTEKIIHNGTVHDASGGTGIPALTDTSFYTMYRK